MSIPVAHDPDRPHPPPRARHRRGRHRRPPRCQGLRDRRRRTTRHAGLAGHPIRLTARWRRRRATDRVDPPTLDRDRPAARCDERCHGRSGVGDRSAGVRVRTRLLLAPQARHRTAGRADDRVRRGDARRRPVRSPDRPVPVLGADVGHVVSADRQRRPQPTSTRRSAVGDPDHGCRRAGDAGRVRDDRPVGRHLPIERARGRSTERQHGHRRHRVGADRGLHEVGPDPVLGLAAGGDGRTDADQRLPARGDDGQGRRLPGRRVWRPVLADVGCLADADHHRVVDHDDRRRLAGVATTRPQAAAGVRHGQPARPS